MSKKAKREVEQRRMQEMAARWGGSTPEVAEVIEETRLAPVLDTRIAIQYAGLGLGMPDSARSAIYGWLVRDLSDAEIAGLRGAGLWRNGVTVGEVLTWVRDCGLPDPHHLPLAERQAILAEIKELSYRHDMRREVRALQARLLSEAQLRKQVILIERGATEADRAAAAATPFDRTPFEAHYADETHVRFGPIQNHSGNGSWGADPGVTGYGPRYDI